MDRTVFGLGCFPRINEEDFKNFYEDFFRKFGISCDKENKEENDEKPEEKDSDIRIYNVIHEGELYLVKGDRFEYSAVGGCLQIFKDNLKVAVFPSNAAIIDESCFYDPEEEDNE